MAIPEPGCCDTEYELLRKILLGLPEIGTGGGGTPLAISDEGVQQTAAATSIDFIGAGVAASAVGGSVTVSIPGGGLVSKFADDVGDGVATTFTVTHNFGTQDVEVQVRENALPNAVVYPDINVNNVNSVDVVFSVAPTLNQYRVIVLG